MTSGRLLARTLSTVILPWDDLEPDNGTASGRGARLNFFSPDSERRGMTADQPTQIAPDSGRTTCGMCFGYGYLEHKTFRVFGGEIECLRCGGTGVTGHNDDEDACDT